MTLRSEKARIALRVAVALAILCLGAVISVVLVASVGNRAPTAADPLSDARATGRIVRGYAAGAPPTLVVTTRSVGAMVKGSSAKLLVVARVPVNGPIEIGAWGTPHFAVSSGKARRTS